MLEHSEEKHGPAASHLQTYKLYCIKLYQFQPAMDMRQIYRP
jgi:hypothetical protein